MEERTFDGHSGQHVSIDACFPCQSFWFDSRESLALTPGATLALFRTISEHAGKPTPTAAGLLKCPRCQGRLRPTKDMQRHMRFEYLSCPHGHGRLTSFLEFLKEKDFVRALTAKQLADLRENVQFLNCSNCGAPVDLAKASACEHCGAPLSMLDMAQAGRLIAQLQSADKSGRPVDPALPLNLERARRQTEANFEGLVRDVTFIRDSSASGLVVAGLQAVARGLEPPEA